MTIKNSDDEWNTHATKSENKRGFKTNVDLVSGAITNVLFEQHSMSLPPFNLSCGQDLSRTDNNVDPQNQNVEHTDEENKDSSKTNCAQITEDEEPLELEEALVFDFQDLSQKIQKRFHFLSGQS
jgi:hypothetical protein